MGACATGLAHSLALGASGALGGRSFLMSRGYPEPYHVVAAVGGEPAFTRTGESGLRYSQIAIGPCAHTGLEAPFGRARHESASLLSVVRRRVCRRCLFEL